MSKSIGNVVNPFDLVKEYGTDALRYYLLREIPPFDDGDFTMTRFKEVYNADLANGLGNLVARVAKLCETTNFTQMGPNEKTVQHIEADGDYKKTLAEYKFNDSLAFIWRAITKVDQFINVEKPWELLKSDPERTKSVLAHCVDQIQEIGVLLAPFMPETSEKIQEQFKGPKIVSQKSLFPRIF